MTAEFGTYRTAPWTVLGEDSLTWEDAVSTQNPLTLEVAKVKLEDMMIGHTFAKPQYAAVRADGHVLHAGHGDQWTPFQVKDAYDFGSALQEASDAQLANIAMLDGGAKYFFTYDLGSYFIGDDEVRDYLSVAGSFDGTYPLLALGLPSIMRCFNQLPMAKRTKSVHYRFKHTSRIEDRVKEARRAIEVHRANRRAHKAVGEQLVATKVSDAEYRNVLDTLFPIDEDASTATRNKNANAREGVNALYRASGAVGLDVASGVEGTGWALIQSINSYENWGTPVRARSGEGAATTRARRQLDQVTSQRQPLTDRALELVLA